MTITKEHSFFVYSRMMEFFCNITERKISLGQGNLNTILFPRYGDIVKKVSKAISACNGTLAEKPFPWPTASQEAAMSPSLFYGEHSGGLYPLQLNVAKEYLNSGFVNCFNDIIGPWAKHEVDSINQQTLIGVGVVLTLAIACFAIYGLYRCNALPKLSLFCSQKMTREKTEDSSSPLMQLGTVGA